MAAFLQRVSDCVKFKSMRVMYRNLILLLLCCLLPVQGALAFARSVGMISHHARLLQTAEATQQTDPVPDVTAQHTGGHLQTDHAHHASHAQHVHAAAPESSDNAEKFSLLTTKKPRHSPASCTDCGKCCLMGAAAPPPVVMQTPVVSFVLQTFKSTQPETAGHIPEKPDRPPRPPAHCLT